MKLGDKVWVKYSPQYPAGLRTVVRINGDGSFMGGNSGHWNLYRPDQIVPNPHTADTGATNVGKT